MNTDKLGTEESELLKSYEDGEWEPIPHVETEKLRYQQAARATFKKDARVNIRISSKDLEALQNRAIEEGLPYQTLIASILHKYVTGRFSERMHNQRG